MPMQKIASRAFLVHWVLAALGLFLFGAATAYHLVERLAFIEERERDRLLGQARVVQENLQRQLIGTDYALQSVRDDAGHRTGRVRNPESMNFRLARLCDALPGVRTLLVAGRDGRVLFSNRDALLGMDLRGRAYFQLAASSSDRDAVFLSPPYQTVLGVWAMNLTRAILTRDGAFAGVAVATLDPDYFKILLRSVNYAEDMWTALAHEDGLQFLMVPDREGQAGKNLARPGSFFTRFRESGQPEMVSSGTVLATGEERMMANVRLSGEGLSLDKALVIGTSRDLSAVTAHWREDVVAHAASFAAVTLLLVLGLTFFHRRWRAHLREAAAVEARLKEGERRFRTVFERSSEAMLILEEGRFVDCNPAALAMLAMSDRSEIVGRPPGDISPPFQPDGLPSGEKAAQMIATAAQRGGHLFEWTHVRADGERFLAEVMLTRILHDGREMLHVAWRDITRRKQEEGLLRQAKEALEAKVRERTEDLVRAVAELKAARNVAESASRMKTTFLAIVSHELRTPLNPILGMLQLALETDLTREQREYLDEANAGAERLYRIIGQVIEYADLEARTPTPGPVALKTLLDILVGEIGPHARAKGLRLDADLGRETASVVRTDPYLVRLILLKLGENAVKFTDSGGVAARLSLEGEAGGGMELVATVSDTGVGLDPGMVQAMTSDFTQAEDPMARRFGGMGLGLAVVRRALQILGGSLLVEGAVGRGASFTVRIPVRPCNPEDVTACLENA